MTRLTEHFTLEEMCVTQHRDIDNTPSGEVITNLAYTAATLERVRAVLKKPIIVSSGYRCPDLNSAIGGARNSRHMLGLAADIIAPQYGTPLMICKAIVEAMIPFDQLIYEFGRWVHIGISPFGEEMRQQVLTIMNKQEGYKHGLPIMEPK